MKKHRGLALCMGVVVAVAAVCPPGQSTYFQTTRAQAEEQAVSMEELSASGESDEKVITITNEKELRLFGKYVNEGNPTEGKIFQLQDDVTLSAFSFEYNEEKNRTVISSDGPVAAVDQKGKCYTDLTSKKKVEPGELLGESCWNSVGTEDVPFQGSFDGKGHTITGMTVIGENDSQGLFGVIGKQGNVSNVRLEDSFAAGKDATGGITGINGGQVSEVESSHNLIMSCACVGGIAGRNIGKIENTTSEDVTIIGLDDTMHADREEMDRINGAGGITGLNDGGNITDCVLKGEENNILYGGGGIAGLIEGGKVTGCDIYGDLESKGGNLGGITGFIFGGEIRRCGNYGNLTIRYDGHPQINLAGIAGGTYIDKGEDIIIDTCFNYGGVIQQGRQPVDMQICTDSIGGITGRHGGGPIVNCGNYGRVGIVTDQSSEGAQIGGGSAGLIQIGGIAGGCDGRSEIINCYNVGQILGDIGYTGGITGRKNGIDICGCYTIGEISQKVGKGQFCGYTVSGSLKSCFYLDGEGREPWSVATSYIANSPETECKGLTIGEVKGELVSLLNAFVQSAMDYLSLSSCTLRSWETGPNGYPVLGTEEEMNRPVESPGILDETPKPERTQEPVISREPEESPGIPQISREPEGSPEVPQISREPEGSPEVPQISREPEGSPEIPQSSREPERSPEVPQSSREPEESSLVPSKDNKQPAAAASDSPKTDIKQKIAMKLKVSDDLKSPKKLKTTLNGLKRIKLEWKKVKGAEGYAVYRMDEENGIWKKLDVTDGKTGYVDRSIKKGKNYRYRIFAYYFKNDRYQRSSVTAGKTIHVPYYQAPQVTYHTETAGGKHYLRIRVQRYHGQYIEIYVKRNEIVQKLKLHPISKYNGIFRLSYKKKKASIYCRVRTWTQNKKQKKYSGYSAMKKVKL